MRSKAFWNTRYMQSPILYEGRSLFINDMQTIKQIIPIAFDVRHFIQVPDFYLDKIVKELGVWDMSSFEDKALACLRYVKQNITYTPDKNLHGVPEFWAFPNETLTINRGDCEEMAILIVSLMRNAGIPAYRVKVAAGLVAAPSATAPARGHAYPLFLREKDEEWVTLDPCYKTNDLLIKDRVPAKDDQNYKEVWFTFNDELSWSNKPVNIAKTIQGIACSR